MATPSEVKAGLDDIATIIRAQRIVVAGLISGGASASNELGNLPGQFADVIATIQAYIPDNEFESGSQSELTELTAEFLLLKDNADSIAATVLAMTV